MSRDWKQTWRLVTAPLRMLPSFIIPGEAKCGTTSFYRYLAQHPDVVPGFRKEPRNFMDQPGSRMFCQCHYPLRVYQYMRAVPHRIVPVTGEATAEYLSRPGTATAIKRILPNVRIIVLLRNPVVRALSDYHMLYRNGVIQKTFDETVSQSLNWYEDEALADLLTAAAESEHFHGRLVQRGLYAEKIRHWFEVFGRDKVLVVKSENLFAEPQKAMNRAFEFLGLRPATVNTASVGRRGRYDTSGSIDVLARLDEFYRAHNQTLYELIGEDLGWALEQDLGRPVGSLASKKTGVDCGA